MYDKSTWYVNPVWMSSTDAFLKHNVGDTLNAYPNSKLFFRYQATITKTWKAFSKTHIC